MRIRKHFPSSSSSLSSLPLSDPQLISRSPSLLVVVQPQYSNHHHLNNNDNNNNLHEEPKRRINPDHRLSSDPHHQPLIHHNHTAATSQQTVIIGTENPALVVCARNNSNIDQQQLEHKEIIKDKRWKTEEEMKIRNDNDIRKDISSIAEVDVQFPQSSSSSSSSCQDKWGEGDRIVPPKKRKGSFARTMGTASKEMIKPKMKSKTNKKCLQQNSDQKKKTHCKEGADTSTGTVAVDTKNTTKKSKRGSVIMEGSRCSRVNGRGWRCCQQTLVGYSLCEHHLGKGRLRSMTSVRNRASNIAMARHNIKTSSTPPTDSSTAAAQQQQNDHSQTPQKQEIIVTTKSSPTWKTYDDDDDDDDDDYKNNNNIINIVAPEEEEEDEMKKPLFRISRKKRKIMKIGSVKARSISSLLGQTDNAGAGAANRNKNSTG